MALDQSSDLPKLEGKRIVEVEHFEHGSVYLYADDGTKIELWSYGPIFSKDKSR